MSTDKKPLESPLVVRAQKDVDKDRTLAEQARETADVAALHAQVIRLIDDRKQLADAFNAVVTGWNMLRDAPAPSGQSDAVAALERVATEAMGLAKEVVRAFTARPPKEG